MEDPLGIFRALTHLGILTDHKGVAAVPLRIAPDGADVDKEKIEARSYGLAKRK